MPFKPPCLKLTFGLIYNLTHVVWVDIQLNSCCQGFSLKKDGPEIQRCQGLGLYHRSRCALQRTLAWKVALARFFLGVNLATLLPSLVTLAPAPTCHALLETRCGRTISPQPSDTSISPYINPSLCTCRHACIQTEIYTNTNNIQYIRTCIHTNASTYARTYVHTCIYKFALWSACSAHRMHDFWTYGLE